ncbi:MAG TPA: hypothetical protein DEQ28_05285, partial [Clostridiales bacterium]|nr:hypothetical protein [Clostridiales bacterium]
MTLKDRVLTWLASEEGATITEYALGVHDKSQLPKLLQDGVCRICVLGSCGTYLRCCEQTVDRHDDGVGLLVDYAVYIGIHEFQEVILA